MKKAIAIVGMACIAGALLNPAWAADERLSQEQLVSTLGCVMLAQKYVAAAAILESRVPRKDAVVALAVTKLPNQTPQEALRDAERILDDVSRQPTRNADTLSDEKFSGCVKAQALPLNERLAPPCWRVLPLLNEVMNGRKKGVTKERALKGLKDAKGVEELKRLDWKALVDRAYQWDRSASEFSVGEVIKCGQSG